MGGAYSALTGPTGLLDGAILGDPGTPFSLLMSRSDLFPGYRDLLLLNVYYPRHVRLVVSLMQMAWDSVEGTGGFLAPPVTEPFPTTLIYAGLGDSTVTTIDSEILARAYSAETFANTRKLSLASAFTGVPSRIYLLLPALPYIQSCCMRVMPCQYNTTKPRAETWCTMTFIFALVWTLRSSTKSKSL